MSELENLRLSLPAYAADIKLNLASALLNDGTSPLTDERRWGSAIAAAIACRNPRLVEAVEREAANRIDAAHIEAARMAAAVMAMTNVYFRAVHMTQDAELSSQPSGLRMNALARHGIAEADFELFTLAASVVKGCEGCTKAHIHGARRHGVGTADIQAILRLAAILHGAATVLDAVGASTQIESEVAA